MVGLVLDGPRLELRAGDRDRFTVHVEALGHHVQGTPGVGDDPGEREAALVTLLALLGEVEDGVDEVPDLVVGVVGEHAQRHPELRGGEPRPGGGEHRLLEVLDELPQLLVEGGDLLRALAEDGVPEESDGLDRHEAPWKWNGWVRRRVYGPVVTVDDDAQPRSVATGGSACCHCRPGRDPPAAGG